MDVDTESEGEEASSSEGEEMNDASSTPQTPKTPKTKKKFKKLKPRKSELNMEALTNEQAALAALESNQILHLRLRKRYYAEGLNFIRQVEGAMWVSFFIYFKKMGEWIIC